MFSSFTNSRTMLNLLVGDDDASELGGEASGECLERHLAADDDLTRTVALHGQAARRLFAAPHVDEVLEQDGPICSGLDGNGG